MKRCAALVALTLTACSSEPTYYTNANGGGQAEFDRDKYQCTRENTTQQFTMVGKIASTDNYTDSDMVRACMKARGWYDQKSNMALSSTSPPPSFAWPVNGKVIATYGSALGGRKNDGIDIVATVGEPVRAAAGGTVFYAGSDVANLGNLLLLQHAGGYLTAYGNNESLLVKKGDQITKGQVIAKAGQRLHFEVRRGSKNTVDPMTVLPPQ